MAVLATCLVLAAGLGAGRALATDWITLGSREGTDTEFPRDAYESACDSSSVCDDCFRDPIWTVTADAMALHRQTPSSATLFSNTVTPTETLDASDFRFGYHTGFDLSAIRGTGCGDGWELRYFEIEHWNAATSAATTAGQLLQMHTAVPGFTSSGTSIDGRYASAVHNGELNRRVALNDCWAIVAGIRYMELDEHLATHLVNSAVPLLLDVTTRNRLYGFQVGTDATVWNCGGPLAVNVVSKAGIFGNAMGQDSTVSTGLVTLPSTDGDGHTSFLCELALTGSYALTDYWFLRGGYRLLWVDGVALATDQVGSLDFAFGNGLTNDGDVFYHGAFGGLQRTW